MIETLVIGTGAAGVSVASRLAEAGRPVTLIDPGLPVAPPPLPHRPYLQARREDPEQWRWLLDRATPPGQLSDTSPKFRAPTLAHVFADFPEAQGIATQGFTLLGSLASGGLTAAWGAGASSFSNAEMAGWPVSHDELAPHYRAVARRVGISGAQFDDLTEHTGLDADGLPGVPLDELGQSLERRWSKARAKLMPQGFHLGRARLAVLTEDRGERQACAGLGLCLWGCPRGSIWSAAQDLARLRRHQAVTHRPGLLAERLLQSGEGWEVAVLDRATNARHVLRARRVVLAAGAIGSARLAMTLSQGPVRLPLHSTPTAAFALLLPRFIGRPPREGVGLGQHLYALGDGEPMVCGYLFPTTGLPLTEFVARAPLSRRVGLRALRWLLPATLVGNTFFHSRYSAHAMTLGADGKVRIEGGFSADFEPHLAATAKRLRSAFRSLGAIALPGSFAPGAPGSDLHYAGTLPMRSTPRAFECNAQGELADAPGLFVADAAALPSLPAKSHTLTIMAWADRLGQRLAAA